MLGINQSENDLTWSDIIILSVNWHFINYWLQIFFFCSMFLKTYRMHEWTIFNGFYFVLLVPYFFCFYWCVMCFNNCISFFNKLQTLKIFTIFCLIDLLNSKWKICNRQIKTKKKKAEIYSKYFMLLLLFCLFQS